MTNTDPDDDRQAETDRPSRPSTATISGQVELFEVDDGVVLLDPENPRAWIESNISFDMDVMH